MPCRIAPALVAALLFAAPALAQDEESKRLTVNSKDAPVDQLLAYVSEITGWKFVFDPPTLKVDGAVTAVSAAPVPMSHILLFLDEVLRPLGLATLNHYSPNIPKQGETVKIVRIEDALKNSDATEMARVLNEIFKREIWGSSTRSSSGSTARLPEPRWSGSTSCGTATPGRWPVF